MYTWHLEGERLEAEAYLSGRRADFTATYMKVANLQFIIEQQPEIIQPGTVNALCRVLEGTEHKSQRQVFFLFKKAAEGLAAIICRAASNGLADQARNTLTHILCTHTGPAFRAAAEAMGTLPLNIHAPPVDCANLPDPVVHPIHHLSEIFGDTPPRAMHWMGRNLVVTLPENPEKRLVFKFAHPDQSLSDLTLETRWMRFMAGIQLPAACRFDIPRPLAQSEPLVYRFHPTALPFPVSLDIDENRYAIGFSVPETYFRYPNHAAEAEIPDKDACQSILCKNARTLGRLAALGIIHTAPIPLFHNRVQRHRRADHGLYEWRRGGRLDQWLASCRYPNIGASGIRDFEHFIAFDGPARRLYDHIGAHIFSLLLIAGSYFRNLDETRIGLDNDGAPIDVRTLFDGKWLTRVLSGVFDNYYEGFTGLCYESPYPCDLENLSRRLVEEMGVDRHMEEILRVAEQHAMSEQEFNEFLTIRGLTPDQVAEIKKGEQDITILTGPHLGGFNQRISIPELTEYTAALSALCIMDRYWHSMAP
ncbi:MAG TPA: SidJ-related pseudokinase [Desulfosalsimonadaceae bacterium]|nr:SidJ-related pseudokinase [Desulfosalsimonadaceae bacterium]